MLAARPVNRNAVDSGLFPEAHVDDVLVGAKVPLAVRHARYPGLIPAFNANESPDGIPFARRPNQIELNKMIAGGGSVFKQRDWSIQMGGHQIRLSIHIEIQHLHTAANPSTFEVLAWRWSLKPSKLALNVSKNLRGHLPRNVVGPQVIDVAIGDGKIEPSIIIQVDQLAAKTELFQRLFTKLGPSRTIHKNPRKRLQIECVNFVIKVRDDQIQEPIAILVAARDAHARLSASDAVHGDSRRRCALDQNTITRAFISFAKQQQIG